jgi:hypothetical protein
MCTLLMLDAIFSDLKPQESYMGGASMANEFHDPKSEHQRSLPIQMGVIGREEPQFCWALMTPSA